MPNLMQRAATWLGARLQDAAGRTVTYRQGRTTVSDLVGWVAAQEYEVVQDGLPLSVTSFDWTFNLADLGTVKPKNGDTITETLNGEEIAYEVMPPGPGMPETQRLDSSGLLLLVRSKRICIDV